MPCYTIHDIEQIGMGDYGDFVNYVFSVGEDGYLRVRTTENRIRKTNIRISNRRKRDVVRSKYELSPEKMFEVIDLFPVKDSSKKTYKANVKKILYYIGDLDVIEDYEKIIDRIIGDKNLPNTTTAQYLSEINSIIKTDPKIRKYYSLNDLKKAMNGYYNSVIEISKGETKEAKKLSPKLSKVKPIYVKKVKEFSEKMKQSENISVGDMLLSLYLLQVPRRLDYLHMWVFDIDVHVIDDPNKNYLVMKPDGWEFVFNKYKTVGKYGQQVIPVSDELRNVLEKMNFKTGDKLYSKTKPTYAKSIKNASKKLFGEMLTVNNIRALHSTVKYGKILDDLIDDANKSGHSINVKLGRYVKH